jgi:ATPase subunit of ABC transporter with duplicated ATPase domains
LLLNQAGAGSGDFHTYRAQRAAERNRLAVLDDQANEEERKAALQAKRLANEQELAAERAKKKRKRQTHKQHVKQTKLISKLESKQNDNSQSHSPIENQEDSKLSTTNGTHSSCDANEQSVQRQENSSQQQERINLETKQTN